MDLAGTVPDDTNKFLCVIGSRNFSSYGKEVCAKLIQGLASYPIVIVSGLAIGIDSIAHEEALKAKLKTIAFPGSGLSKRVLYPSSQRQLAYKIVEEGGALLSPFMYEQEGAPWTFPTRNTLMAGSSHATLIIEAREKSGTLITAKAAGNCSRDLLAVPGSIFSELSLGPHELIREGATAITTSTDILEALGLIPHSGGTQQSLINMENLSLSPHEKTVVNCLRGEILNSTDLMEKTSLSASVLNVTISELELRGLIKETGGRYRLM